MKQDMIVILDLGSHENTVLARAILTVEISKAVEVSLIIDDGGTKASEKATFVKIGSRWCCMKAMEDMDYVCQNNGYNVW